MFRENIILNLIKDQDVLDIGSVGQTNSYNLWRLLKRGQPRSLTGIDLPDAEKQLEVTFNLTQVERNDAIVHGNMETYKFGKKFDVIIAGDVIEHVGSQAVFLKNIKKHLRPNGKLLLTTPNAKWPTVFFKPNPTHTLWHDKYTLGRILTDSGFRTVYFSYYSSNKGYNFIIRILLARQAMLVIAE